MGRRKRNYSKEFKLDAVRLVVDEGLRVKIVAAQMGINETMLHGWVSRYKTGGEKAFVGSGNLQEESAAIRKLKREIADLREENEILKKAAAYFAEHPELK